MLLGLMLLAAARFYGQRAADQAYDRILAASALAIAEQVYAIDGQVQVDLPYASLDMLAFARDDRVFYRVLGPQGRTLTGYEDLPVPPAGPAPGTARFFDADYRGETVRFVALGRLLAEPQISGWATVQVGQTRHARDALANEMALGASAPILVFMLGVVALVWFGVQRGLRPLDRVEAELDQRQPTELAPLQVQAPQEIHKLVHAINDFMSRLDRSFAHMQSFIADAAHQIRTPLASLHAQTQLARDEQDPQRLQYLLKRIDHNARLASRLTNQLLSHATVTHRANVKQIAPLDLVKVVQQAAREAVPLADDRLEDLLVRIHVGSAPVLGDRVAIREALRNLIENAFHHGPDQGEVTVELARVAEGYACTVTDAGAGIPRTERERVMQRFERGSGASGEGSGLGLAIVQAVAEQHGARIEFLELPGVGFGVRMFFPELG